MYKQCSCTIKINVLKSSYANVLNLLELVILKKFSLRKRGSYFFQSMQHKGSSRGNLCCVSVSFNLKNLTYWQLLGTYTHIDMGELV